MKKLIALKCLQTVTKEKITNIFVAENVYHFFQKIFYFEIYFYLLHHCSLFEKKRNSILCKDIEKKNI
jgi:hypothetical protein